MTTTTATATPTVTPATLNVTNKPELREAIASLKAAKAAKLAAEKAIEAAESIINPAMVGYDEAIILSVTALKRSSLRTNVTYNGKILNEQFPAAAAASRQEKHYTFWTVS
jgi:hypothetical protein